MSCFLPRFLFASWLAGRYGRLKSPLLSGSASFMEPASGRQLYGNSSERETTEGKATHCMYMSVAARAWRFEKEH